MLVVGVNKKGSGRSARSAFAASLIEPLKAVVIPKGSASTGANHECTSQRGRCLAESRRSRSRGHRSDVPQRLSAQAANRETGGLFLSFPSRPTRGVLVADG